MSFGIRNELRAYQHQQMRREQIKSQNRMMAKVVIVCLAIYIVAQAWG